MAVPLGVYQESLVRWSVVGSSSLIIGPCRPATEVSQKEHSVLQSHLRQTSKLTSVLASRPRFSPKNSVGRL